MLRSLVESQPWTFNGTHGRLFRTRSYRLYTTENSPYILERLPGFLEASLDRYCTHFGGLPRPRVAMDTYLFANRGQWKRFTHKLLGRKAELYVRIPRGGYALRGTAVLWQIGPHDTFALAAHEGWHQYAQQTFRDPLPVWIEEGIATNMEGYRFRGRSPIFLTWANTERFDQLRDAEAADRLFPLDELLRNSPQNEMQEADHRELEYYAQVWALVHFLMEGEGGKYRPGLVRLLQDAAAGQMRDRLLDVFGPRAAVVLVQRDRNQAIFRAYFNDDLNAASREYARFIQRVVQPGSRGAIVEGRNPLNHD